jgi:assimilatory nitrate reductase catalytic subunit
LADLLLPAAAWGEKDGTLINSERRINLIKRTARAPGEALSDFSILRLIATAWGVGDLFQRWTSPEAVFHILKDVSRGQPCDITGITDYRLLDERGGIQWPYPELDPDPAPQRRLLADRRFYHADGKAKFLFDRPAVPVESPGAKYPLLLLTGRGSASQWHTQTRTAKSAVLRTLYPSEAYVEINPVDARRIGIQPNQRVVVESQRGSLFAKAFITHSVQPGHVLMPMHYETTNRLTLAHFDPHSRQPSYKNCAVSVRAIENRDRAK